MRDAHEYTLKQVWSVRILQGTSVGFKILVTAQVLGFGIWIGLWPRACQ